MARKERVTIWLAMVALEKVLPTGTVTGGLKISFAIASNPPLGEVWPPWA
jgi:hypothetical protein